MNEKTEINNLAHAKSTGAFAALVSEYCRHGYGLCQAQWAAQNDRSAKTADWVRATRESRYA